MQLPKKHTKFTPFSKYIVVALFILLLFLGFYLYMQYTKKVYKVQRPLEGERIVSLTPAPSITTLQNTVIPFIRNDWVWETSNICNIQIPLPPTKEPYIVTNDSNSSKTYNDTGRIWQYEEYASGMFPFGNSTTARAVFRGSTEAGSEFVSGDVEVMCETNTNPKAYSNQYLVNTLSETFPNGITIKSQKPTIMWGMNVIVLKLQGGSYGDEDNYIFTTSKNLYWVREIVGSSNQSVKDATNEIFSKLKFY